MPVAPHITYKPAFSGIKAESWPTSTSACTCMYMERISIADSKDENITIDKFCTAHTHTNRVFMFVN